MIAAELAIPFGFGLISSLHCAQMCGPIVLSYSMGGRGCALSHALYNLGRICTYATLGAAAGAAGNAVGFLGRMAGYERIAALIAGALLIAAGILMAGVLPKSGLVRIERFGLPRLFSRSVGRLLTSHRSGSRFALGLVLGFLPCGLSYAAVLQSLATGSALGGALSMAAFGVGTSASLLAIGLFSSAIGARMGRWNTVLATASVILMGAFLLYRGIMPGPAMTMGRNCHGNS